MLDCANCMGCMDSVGVDCMDLCVGVGIIEVSGSIPVTGTGLIG